MAYNHYEQQGRLARLRLIDLNTPDALRVARLLVPVLFGFYSLWLGADTNWDLMNYHLYNPFAWLHDKLSLDLAPAGIQSYFNPLLDLVLYWANTHLPSRVVGFALGWLHGLNFVLILGIVQRVLTDLPEKDRYRVPLLLALAGCLTGNFLSGLGNSMGDDTTVLFTLAGLLLLLSAWDWLGAPTLRAIGAAVAAGVLVGLGVGLKLTNAVFAVALCVGLLSYPAGIAAKLRIGVLFGVGVLAGMAATGGYWHFHMWERFGNPLYPQFGMFFPNPMATPDVAGDIRWRPHGFWENVLWPILITLDSGRVGETPIRQVIWSLVYVLLLAWAVRRLLGRKAASIAQPLGVRARLIVLFVVVGFVVWMRLFSIYRYIVGIEMLAPLLVWIVLNQLLPADSARRVAKWALVGATAVVVTGGARTWGHEGWSDPLYHAQLPTIAQPERTTVIIGSTRGNALTWLATLFPPQVAFMQVDSSFPGTDLFRERMRETARTRGGPVYAIVDGEYNGRADSAARADRIVDTLGLTRGERGCAALRWAAHRLRLHVSVAASSAAGRLCELQPLPADIQENDAKNHENLVRAAEMFQRNGFDLQLPSCIRYSAGIGTGKHAYQWCQVSLR
ncbi:hypothetical protein [Burkholderia stagnalis]|uniref:hypothetical protein n=1 Tax=Burkholderia stagnalis TaxID=1503054 RepID=UPI000F7FBCDD|nr:hypothetical protein [Burkholderia stagnalis]